MMIVDVVIVVAVFVTDTSQSTWFRSVGMGTDRGAPVLLMRGNVCPRPSFLFGLAVESNQGIASGRCLQESVPCCVFLRFHYQDEGIHAWHIQLLYCMLTLYGS
jgi:hypothetical protein